MGSMNEGGAFFALIGEGVSLLQALDENAPDFFERLSRLREILAQLGEPVDLGPRLSFSLADKEASGKSLAAYLDGGLGTLPAALQAFEAVTVSELAEVVGDYDLSAQAQRSRYKNQQGSTEDSQIAAYEEIAARGVAVEIDREKVLANIEASKALMRQGNDPEFERINGEISELNRNFSALQDDTLQRIDAARKATDNNTHAELTKEFEEAYRTYKARFAELTSAARDRLHAFEAEKAAKSIEAFKDDGEAVIAAVLAASPITQEHADEWATRQIVDDKAVARLRKLGYPHEQLRRDMAEFYRLVGGKSSVVRITSDGATRASAGGVEARLDEKVIRLGSRFDKAVLFHELAHYLENDPIAKAASNGFLLKRREDAYKHQLRTLTGNKGYRNDEVAYRDSWMNAYVGKVYRDGVTEVFSMGVEYLANPKDAAIFAAKDPEHFALVSGYLTSPLTPAMHAKLNMHTGAIDDLTARRLGEEEQYQAALAALAARITITLDGWWEDLQANDPYTITMLRDFAFSRGKDPRYLGSHGPYRLFEGVFRNRNTSRNAKGYLVVTAAKNSFIPDSQAIHGGIDMAKAFIAIAEHRAAQGITDRLSNVFNHYFYERRSAEEARRRIIEAASSALGSQP